jgi:hypothetical protein
MPNHLWASTIAYGLFFIHLATRRVFMCPMTYHPDERWVLQQARHLLIGRPAPTFADKASL